MAKKLFLLLLIIFPVAVFAVTQKLPSPAEQKKSVVSAFKYYKNVSPSLAKTSVVEVSFLENSFVIPVFAVYNVTTSVFEPNLLSVKVAETKSRIETNASNGSAINDGNYGTYAEFPLSGDSGRAEIIFYFEKPITASSLSFALDANVALPQSISVSADVSGKNYVVLAPVRPSPGNILFPKTTSAIWRVNFNYVQPLRISEMKFNDTSSVEATKRGLRFLAQPGESYQIYFDADRYVQSTNREAGDLFSNTGVVQQSGAASILNPEYKPADSDSDSVPDFSDNCVSVPNSDQKDSDQNGRGDACEDDDRDNVLNIQDNCPQIPNAGQGDTDTDGTGDICDTFDNRPTERMPWLPWVGIGVAGLVVLGLFVLVLKHKKQDSETI